MTSWLHPTFQHNVSWPWLQPCSPQRTSSMDNERNNKYSAGWIRNETELGYSTLKRMKVQQLCVLCTEGCISISKVLRKLLNSKVHKLLNLWQLLEMFSINKRIPSLVVQVLESVFVREKKISLKISEWSFEYMLVWFEHVKECLMCPAGGHRDQWRAGESAHEAGREWRGLLRQRDGEHAGE